MSVGTITADGSTKWKLVSKGDTFVSLAGTFGSGTVALEKKVNGIVSALYDAGTAITATANDDMALSIGEGTNIRFTTTGSTTPSITWSITAID